MSSKRSRVLVLCLSAVFALLAESAFATHFRFGYIFWERDLTYVPPPTAPSQVRVKVVIEGGLRWTYPSYTAVTPPPGFTGTPRIATSAAVNCAGVVTTATDMGTLSCPNFGSIFTLAGGTAVGVEFESPTSSQQIQLFDEWGNNKGTFSVLPATNPAALPMGATATLALTPVVTQVLPTQDTFYGRMTFYVLMDSTKPLRVTWQNGNRISQLLDSNNDIPWRLQTTIDLTNPSVTKSPKTSMLAVSQVFANQNNVITLPSAMSDNLVAKWRLATTGESFLNFPSPAAPSVFTLDQNTGVVNFTPRAVGPYAVQFILSGADPNTGQIRTSVPIDVMFQAVTPTAVSATLATGDGQTAYTATVPQPISYTVRATTTPPNAAYRVTINPNNLPPGGSFTQPVCSGDSVCVGTFNWTPTVTSTPSLICYSAVVTNGAVFVAQSSSMCVTVNLNPLATALTSFPASGAAGGGPLVLSARLTRVLDGAPLPGRTITFTYPSDPNNPPWIGTASAITDSTGLATATVTSVSPVEAAYTANFSAITNELLQSSSSTNVVSIKAATTVMNTPQVQTSPLPTIGYPLSATALLNRVFTDGGTLAVGANVQFTLSGPGSSEIASGVTGANGVAGVTFGAVPQNAGPYTVEATFAGNAALFGLDANTPTTATTAPFTLKRRTQISMSPATATVGVPAQIVVSLLELPGLAVPLAGRTVQIAGAFTGSPMTTTTGANGQAVFDVTFPAQGSVAVSAAYTPLAGETNRNGVSAVETANQSVVVSKSATQLSLASTPSTATVGQPFAATAALTRSTPAGPVSGATVSFTLTQPGGASQVLSAVTDASGNATVTFSSVTVIGTYTLSASFATTASLAAASTTKPITAVTAQPTTISPAPASGFAGAPITLTAHLQTTSAPLSGQPVHFTIGASSIDATTNVNGDASGTYVPSTTGTFTYSASFAGAPGFAPSSGNSTVSVAFATTALAPITINSTSLVGDSLAASTSLSRTSAPAGPMPGEAVTFTLTAPGGIASVQTAATDATGFASVTFPMLTVRGSYTLTASFAGDGAHAASSRNASLTVFQKTTLLMNAANGIAGDLTTLTAALTAIPQGTPITGQAVTFSTGSSSASSVTDPAGVASSAFSFPNAGTLTAAATFNNLADYFVDQNGNQVPTVSSAAITISGAQTNLAAFGLPSQAFVGDPLFVQTLLTRISTPAGAIAGANVMFTLTGPAGPNATVQTISGSTASGGQVMATLTLGARGLYTVTATYAGDAGNLPTTVSQDISVYQKATIFPLPANGLAAKPTTISVLLATAPAGLPLSGQTVTFTFSGGGNVPAPQSAVTDNSGTASVTVTFPTVGSYSAIASFSNVAGFFASSGGTLAAEARSIPIVISNTAPTIVDLPDITAPATSASGRVVTFTSTGNDAEDGALTPTCTAPSGGTFPIGSTSVTCSVTDAAGATASDSFTITITNNAPTFTAPANISLPATGPNGRAVTFSALGNDVEDGTLTADCQAQSGNTFPIGTTTVNCTVTDAAGAAASDSFSVTITNTVPTIVDLPDITASATSSSGRVVTFTSTGNDAEDGALTPTCTAPSGGTFPIGSTSITCSVTDIAGATASDSFTITITNTAPTIVDLPNIFGEATGAAGRVMSFTSTGSDAEDGALTPVCNATSGATFPIGTTSVSCTVTDVAGYTATDSFTITVVDTTAPVLSLPTIAPAVATSAAGRVVTYTTSALDVVDGATAVTCAPVSGSTFPIATTTVTCTTSDTRGNTSTGSFAVSVTNSAPTILDLPNLSGEATSATGRAFTFTSTGNDAEDGALTPVCNATSGATFPIGITNVTCTVTDVAGATASDSFTIEVKDTTAPAVTVASITVEQTSPAGAVGVYAFSASDIVDGALTPSCTPASGTTFARGVTTVTCTTTDAHGNTGSATASVTVNDTIKPVVTYTGNAGTYSADQTVSITCAATDSGSGVASTTCANITGPAYSFAVGVNNFSATATDVAGNTNSASTSFTVIVPPAAVGNVITTLVDSPAVAAKMNQTLTLASGAPNASARAAHLNKLVSDIQKEVGKTLTAAEAATLIQLLQQLY